MSKIIIGIVLAIICFSFLFGMMGYTIGYDAGKTKFEKPQLEGIRFLLGNFSQIIDYEFLYRNDGTLAGVRLNYNDQLIYDDMDNDLFIDYDDWEDR